MKAYYTTADQARNEILNIRQNSILIGESLGIPSLDDLVTIKKGYPFFIAGMPHSGKTEFTFEIMINLSERLGWRHFVYSPETGSAAEIYAKLAHKKAGKPVRLFKAKGQENRFAMSDAEFEVAYAWIREYFVIMDPDTAEKDTFTLREFCDNVLQCEAELGIKFDTVMIDPFIDLDDDREMIGVREDKQLKFGLRYVRKFAKSHNKCFIIVHHTADVKPIVTKEGNRYVPPPMPNEWAGGKMWHRLAFTMLLVWRPPTFLLNDNGEPFAENETIIFNQKAKPEGTGRLGSKSIFWDWRRSRYYCSKGTPVQEDYIPF